jgi:hypothetical protein
MMNQTSVVLALVALLLVSSSSAFQVQRTSSSTSSSKLYNVIRGEELDGAPFDQLSGGIRLAMETAVKAKGDIKHGPGKADAKLNELIRYNKMTLVEESQVVSALGKVNGSILCKGSGKESYQDPGSGTEKIVILAPRQAIKDALNEAGSASTANELILNFLGGDDLIMKEVIEAANELVLDLDAATSTKIRFNSISHSSIPAGTCTIATVVKSKGKEGESSSSGADLSGVEKAIANGDVYFHVGKWYTVEESEINTSEA